MLKIRILFALAYQNKFIICQKIPRFFGYCSTSATFVFKLKKCRFLRQNTTFLRPEYWVLNTEYRILGTEYNMSLSRTFSDRINVIFCLKKRRFFNLKTNVALVSGKMGNFLANNNLFWRASANRIRILSI